MASDPFSDVLRLAEAKSVLSGALSAGGTWAVRFRARGKMKFYTVAEGACWLCSEEEESPLLLQQGDVLFLSGPTVFVVGSDPSAAPQDVCPVFESGKTFARIGSRADCVLLTGVVSLHPSSASLFTSALPPVVHVRAAAPDAAALRWMIERIEHERRSALPGAQVVSAQFAQILFIQALRAHLTSAGALPAGWLRAVRDERLVRALRLMHDEPGRGWRLTELSKASGMSRARFAAHFKSEVGVAPLAYLTQWRMRIAQKRLRDEATAIVDLAASLGYGSESAFSHAFKRTTGTGPRAYRAVEGRRASATDRAVALEGVRTSQERRRQRDVRASLRDGRASG